MAEKSTGMVALVPLKKINLDFSPKITHIILHPRPKRDWTRAVVFGWVGSGSCGMGYRSSFLGRSTQKVWVAGWPPATMPVGSNPFGGIPSHPPVRHYDRSEPMRLTNLRCGKAIPGGIPSPHQDPPLPLSQRLERVAVRAKSGSLDRIIRARGAARRSTQHSPAPKRRPRPLLGAIEDPPTRRGNACGLHLRPPPRLRRTLLLSMQGTLAEDPHHG